MKSIVSILSQKGCSGFFSTLSKKHQRGREALKLENALGATKRSPGRSAGSRRAPPSRALELCQALRLAIYQGLVMLKACPRSPNAAWLHINSRWAVSSRRLLSGALGRSSVRPARRVGHRARDPATPPRRSTCLPSSRALRSPSR